MLFAPRAACRQHQHCQHGVILLLNLLAVFDDALLAVLDDAQGPTCWAVFDDALLAVFDDAQAPRITQLQAKGTGACAG